MYILLSGDKMYIRDRYDSKGDLIESLNEYTPKRQQELVEFLNEVYDRADENFDCASNTKSG